MANRNHAQSENRPYSKSSVATAPRLGPNFRLQDAFVCIAYLAILLWFSQIVIELRNSAFANLRPFDQATQLILVMVGIGSVSTLPLVWLFYSLKSKQRNAAVMPAATTLLINYGTLAVGKPVATMGIATAFAALLLMAAKRWRTQKWPPLQRIRGVLILQIICYLIAGIIGRL